jgi:hypothetical protein
MTPPDKPLSIGGGYRQSRAGHFKNHSRQVIIENELMLTTPISAWNH